MPDPNPPAAEAQRAVLDRSALEVIRSLQSDAAPDLLARVVRAYLESAPGLISRLREGMASLDHETIRIAAHTLKSSSANLGAKMLADLCKKLELAARVRSIGPDTPGVLEIEREYGAVRQALEMELTLAR